MSSEMQMGKENSPHSGNAPADEGMALNASSDKACGAIPTVIAPYEAEWKTESLIAHYDIRSGLSKPAKEFGLGYPFLTFKDVFYNFFAPEQLGDLVQSTDKERELSSVRRGDVFLTRTSETMHELGMSCVALRDYPDATFNGFCKRLRPKPDSDLVPEYVGYFLRGPSFRQAMLSMSTMSTRASLNNEMIARLEITYPPKEMQSQIAAILKSLDDRIALLRETNATLEAMAQALFKSWFVDFDPVHANAGTQAATLPPELQTLFPVTLTKTPQGLVPEGWGVACLNEICQIASGKRPEIRSDTESEGAKVPLYGGAGVMGYTDKSLFNEKKILTGRVGTLGKVHIATPPFWASDNVLVLTPKDQSNFYFSLNWLLAIDVHSLNRGSTQPLLTQKDLGAQQRALPPNEILIEFEYVVAELYLKIQANSQQAQTLATLRDTLLPRLISGQLRLPDAEAALAEVV